MSLHLDPHLDVRRRHLEVIAKSAEADTYEELVKFLLMVRKKVKDSKVDSELVFAYAKTGQLGPLEEFISGAQQANLQSAGDRCVHCARLGRHCSSAFGVGTACVQTVPRSDLSCDC